jgi:hypothetical protein
MWITPTTSSVEQSDIFENVYFYCVDASADACLVAPICDLVNSKADNLVFCRLFPAYQVLDQFLQEKWAGSLSGAVLQKNEPLVAGQKKYIESQLTQLSSNFHYLRYHWLDPFPGEDEPRIIDYQVLACLNTEEFERDRARGAIKRKLSMLSPWREQIPVRYANYMARIGVPDNPTIQAQMTAWLKTRFLLND